MQMHPYYTEIPLRSFEAMAFDGHLSEVLLALIVDPHEADDVSRTIWDVQEARIELLQDGRIVEAPIRMDDFLNLPSKNALEHLKITLAQWVFTFERAPEPMGLLTKWSPRLGVWCACSVAKEIHWYDDNDPVLRSIEVAEQWVIENRYAILLTQEYNKIFATAQSMASPDYTAAYLAVLSAHMAWDNECDPSAVADVVSDTAWNVADWWANSTNTIDYDMDVARSAELVRLREVVANACMTFPG